MKALVRVLLFALSAGQASSIVINKQTALKNQNGDIILGSLSPGYFSAPNGASFVEHGSAAITLGTMTSFIMNKPATCDLEDRVVVDVGSYSLFTLDSNCKFSMSRQSNIVKFQNAQDGRSELYCNGTFSLGTESYLTMQPQSLIYTNAEFTIGQSIYVNLKQGAVFTILHTTIIQDYAEVNLEQQARFDVLATATGVVTITSGTTTPPKTTYVRLHDSSKIINEGSMTIGGGQSTNVNLFKSGLLKIGPTGDFTIKSSNFDIGPSSFWIINGTFSFDEGSTLTSALQSNITVGQTGQQEAGTFKTLTGGNVTVGAGGSLHLTGVAQVTGALSLAASAHVAISGTLRMTKKSVGFHLNYASTASIAGSMAIQGGTVSVASFSGLNVDSYASLTLTKGLTMGERSYLSFAFTGLHSCFSLSPITIKPYTSHVITTANQAQALGFLCS